MVHKVKGANRGPVVSLFDIRIGTNEKDVIVITPSELESSPTLVQGKVVLSLNDTLSVRNITLRMYGVASVAWFDPTASNRTPPTRASQKQTKTIFDKEWSFLPQPNSTFTLNQGNYEYPFEVLLPDDIPESVEGLPGGAIVYKMKAVVERTGLVNKNIACRKHIRIVRTMSHTSFEFLQSQSIDNLWPNKCQYTIEIPTTAHIIGSQIPFHIHMIPHIKGLSICRIHVELKEHYVFAVLDSKNALIAEKKMERSIRSMMSNQRPAEEDDWHIHGHIEVPNSLDRCTQDCDGGFIKVKHRHVTYQIRANRSIKFVIGLQNPDGHVSEIRASLPCALVLPPDISASGMTPHLDDSTVNHLFYLDNCDVLPSYESRIYDRLWDGVSYGGLDTNPLYSPIAISRRTSTENLRELNQFTMPHPGDLEAGLHRALRQRNAGDPESLHDTAPESGAVLASMSGSTTLTHSAPITRQQGFQQLTDITRMTSLNEDDENVPLSRTSSPEMLHISPTISSDSSVGSSHSVVTSASEDYIDMGLLSRVPSYGTANSSVLNLDPITNALPTYTLATSNLPTISEEVRSRSGSPTSSRSSSRSPEAPVQGSAPAERRMSTGDIGSRLQNIGRIRSVYGGPHNFDDPMRRISLMRSLFSSR